MSEDRDTHFLGFAKLLTAQLDNAMGDWAELGNDNWRKDFETIIAQHAYYLVLHTIVNIDTYHLDAFEYEDNVADIPDLTPEHMKLLNRWTNE
jgi:hypothetical protein